MSQETQMVTEADVIKSGVPPRMMDKYVNRVLKAEYKPSKSSGNPMVEVECEVCGFMSNGGLVKTKKIDGISYAIDGLKYRIYFPMIVTEKGQIKEEETKKARGRYLQFRKSLGLNPSFDPSNPGEKELEGVVFEQILNSTQRSHTRINDEGKEEPIIDEATKQPLKAGWQIQALDVIGRSSVDVNKPF